MGLFDKHPNALTTQEVEGLVEQQARESLRLEFKRSYYLNPANDDKKLEPARDVAAMANTEGGLIVYGIGEKKRDGTVVASSLHPLPTDPSEVLDQILAAHISPPATYQFGWIPASKPTHRKKGYLVLRVLPTELFLHSVAGTFYRRSEKGRRWMTADEVRVRTSLMETEDPQMKLSSTCD